MNKLRFYAVLSRPLSTRAIRDAYLSEQIEAVFFDPVKGRSIAGARKVWHYLLRDSIKVGRGSLERLMARLSLQGVRRDGKRVVTTVPDTNAPTRPPS